ncbi:hypothetical protein LZ31DRAFT_34185 [Colletotrichum somersetense]|nr:hypothetical protein LZ31DRAFT_34185 [Colletotrichum somersetense]
MQNAIRLDEPLRTNQGWLYRRILHQFVLTRGSCCIVCSSVSVRKRGLSTCARLSKCGQVGYGPDSLCVHAHANKICNPIGSAGVVSFCGLFCGQKPRRVSFVRVLERETRARLGLAMRGGRGDGLTVRETGSLARIGWCLDDSFPPRLVSFTQDALEGLSKGRGTTVTRT